MRSIRVLIVDGHANVRRELAETLRKERGIDLVGVAANGQEALQQVRGARPDLVLLDVKMNDGTGVETCRRLAAVAPATRVAVLTSYADDVERQAVLSAGACACLLKEIGVRQLAEAIRALGTARAEKGEGGST